MKTMLNLTRQSGDKVFVNPDNVNYITSTEHLGQAMTEVNFVGRNQVSLMVVESIEAVESMFNKSNEELDEN